MFLAIPLSRLGIRAAKNVEALRGKKIPFDAVSYNAEYDETRYYEGPSKGTKRPAGTVLLSSPEGD